MKRLALLSFLILLGACKEQVTGGPRLEDHASKPQVLTSNYPLYFFASEIAGDAVDVQMPDVDGALVGGASLDAETFSEIINF